MSGEGGGGLANQPGVSSKLTQICHATGDEIKQDLLDARLLLQINGLLDEIYKNLVLNYSED